VDWVLCDGAGPDALGTVRRKFKIREMEKIILYLIILSADYIPPFGKRKDRGGAGRSQKKLCRASNRRQS